MSPTATKSKPAVVDTKPTPEDEARKAQLSARLDELTRDIRTAQQSFEIIANGVYEIDKQKLYVFRQNGAGEAYESLAEYTEDQFQFSAIETSRYRNGGEVLKVLRENGVTTLPKNESQTRALWKVYADKRKKLTKEGQSDDQRKAVIKKAWDKVVGTWNKVKDGKATAERIESEGDVSKVPVGDHRRKAPTEAPPVYFDATADSEAALKSLEDALQFKPQKIAGFARFVPPSTRTDYEIMLKKVSDWFSKEGPRTITIRLSK